VAYKSSTRGTRPVRLIAVHTAEGARTAKSLGAYFFRGDVQASSHVGIDADTTLQYVPYSKASWTLRSGNPISDNAELCGFARWTREQWLSDKTIDKCESPRRMLRRCSAWIAERCKARGIDVRRLTVVQLAKGEWGVIAHDDWTKAMKDGTHWDPGPGFPWDVVLADARALSRGTIPQEDDVELTTPWNETTISGQPGTVGHTLLNIKQNAKAARDIADGADEKVVAALQPTLQGVIAALDALTDAINNQQRTDGASIDYKLLAKAVNDDAHARMEK
jgi:hypothetical protein